MNDQDVIALIRAYTNGTLTPADELVFYGWFRATGLAEFLRLLQMAEVAALTGNEPIPEAFRERLEASLDTIDIRTENEFARPTRRILPVWRWTAIAAATIGILIGGYLFLHRDQPANPPVAATDVPAPLKNRAAITLSNGTKVYLDSAAAGAIAKEGNTQILKRADGAVSYTPPATTATTVAYNTLSNPRGSKVVTLTLSDGTRVWLNVESSLKYPVTFTGDNREVEVTGEAYFEVKHDAARPFRVRVGDQVVQDIGTSFDIDAYDSTKTTLIAGAVQIGLIRLKPGEQYDGTKISRHIDLDEILAWKNGNFEFNGTPLPQIVNQIARWYDLDVHYVGKPPQESYYGIVSRSANLSQVLRIMQGGGVHFIINGKKLTVQP